MRRPRMSATNDVQFMPASLLAACVGLAQTNVFASSASSGKRMTFVYEKNSRTPSENKLARTIVFASM